MTVSAALLCAALAQTGEVGLLDPVVPAPLTGLVAAEEEPIVTPLTPDLLPGVKRSERPVIRGQSPGFAPSQPIGPGFGGPGFAPPGGVPPFAPNNPVGPEFAAPRYEESFGVNGPQPYDFAPEFRFDAGQVFSANAEGRPDRFGVTELDFRYEIDSPGPFGGVFTVAPEYSLRTLDGPSNDSLIGQPPLPGALHRLGIDFAVTTPRVGGFSAMAGFTPSFASDFEDDLTEAGRQYDGRGAVFFEATPELTFLVGAKYYDRANDLVLPWAGAVWRPGDRWEIRVVFPNPRIEYFWGPVWGKPMWVYAEGQFHREAWQFSPGETGFPATDQVQFDDLRFLVGARKEQGWGRTFLEAGIVFDREVSFRSDPSQNFDVGEALILRGGIRF